MQGTSHRERSLYFQAAQSAGLPIINQHHDRVKPTLTHYSYLQYIKAIKSSKYVFTNGYLNSRESIVVGRAFETLATGGVLLYERGSKLSMFYQEYSDFVPVHNISDFIEKMNFLLNNSHISHDIGKRASVRTFCSYNSNIFWKIALSKLGFM
jgi:spore maturation protein CgeB